MPVRAPDPSVITPLSTVTLPAPKKSDSFQPASDLPSKRGRHSPADCPERIAADKAAASARLAIRVFMVRHECIAKRSPRGNSPFRVYLSRIDMAAPVALNTSYDIVELRGGR